MPYLPSMIMILSVIVFSLLDAAEEPDPTLRSLNERIEQITKKIGENWENTTKEEVQGQEDFIGNWEDYQKDLNAIKELNENRRSLQNELKRLKEEKANYLKKKTTSQ